MRRQLTVASRIKPGTVARINGREEVVARVTGSPGRPPASGERLHRLFLEGRRDFVAVRANTVIEIRPR